MHPSAYTSQFGLNSSQGTYLADLKPTSTSFLGRLLREAHAMLPRLIPQEPVRDNVQSRYNFEIKHGPLHEPVQPPVESPASNDHLSEDLAIVTPIREPTSPLLATKSSFAALPAQLLPLSIPIPETSLVQNTPKSVDTRQYQYPHPYGITNTQSSFSSFIDGNNLPPQDIPYCNSGTPHSERIQQDDMDCSPPASPMLLSDVDMDVLTDTAPAPPSYDHAQWTQWNMIPEYTSMLPPYHNTFVAPQPASIWQTPVQEPPPSVNQYSSGFLYTPSFHAAVHTHWDAAGNDSHEHSIVSAAPEPPVNFSNPNLLPPSESTYHPFPLAPINAMSDQIQDTIEIHWQELPRHAGTPHPVSVATLLDEFERSLTLVADETPSSKVDHRTDHNRHPELTPARIIKDELRNALEPIAIFPPQTMFDPARSNDHLGDSELDWNSVCDADGNIEGDVPLFERETTELLGDGKDRPPPPFEREATEALEEGEDQPPAYFLDLADQPQPPLDPVSLPDPPASCPAPRIIHPLSCPRPPTPPPSRYPAKPVTSHSTSTNQRTMHLTANSKRLATKKYRVDLAQASVQAARRAKLQAQLGGARVLRSLPGRAQHLRADEAGGGASRWKTALAVVVGTSTPVCYGRRREEEDTCPDRRDRKKRARFVVEDEAESPLARARIGKALPSSSNTQRTTGPLRSILRNARTTAMPYHTGRKASVA